MDHSTLGLPVHHPLPEFTQTHAHQVGDAIQPSHPQSSPSPPAPNPSQHQGLFQRVNSSHEVAKVSASASVLPMNTLDTCISKLCHLAPQASLTYRSETPGSMRHFLWAKNLLLSPVLSGLGSSMVDWMEILWNLALTLEEGVRKPAGSARWEGNNSDKWAFSLRKSPWVLKACGAE